MVSEIEQLRKDLLREIDYYSDNEKEKRQDRQTIINLLAGIKEILNKNYNMNATKLKANKSIDEQLHEIRHILKVLAKGQQTIINHLGRQENQPEAPSQDDQLAQQKEHAINYINSVVIPEIKAHEAEQGEIGVQGLQD